MRADREVLVDTRGRCRAMIWAGEIQASLDLGEALLEARWVIFSSVGTSVPVPFLAVLIFWLTITFASFGLFAPRNATVIAVLFVCTLS